MLRGTSTNVIILLVGAIIISIIAVTVTLKFMNVAQSSDVRSENLANTIALYINSLSSMESGSVDIELENKYDIEIEDKDGILRKITHAILPSFLEKYIDRPGYYVVVTPYRDGEKGDSKAVFILVYSEREGDFQKPNPLVGVTEVCIVKELGKELAEVRATC